MARLHLYRSWPVDTGEDVTVPVFNVYTHLAHQYTSHTVFDLYIFLHLSLQYELYSMFWDKNKCIVTIDRAVTSLAYLSALVTVSHRNVFFFTMLIHILYLDSRLEILLFHISVYDWCPQMCVSQCHICVHETHRDVLCSHLLSLPACCSCHQRRGCQDSRTSSTAGFLRFNPHVYFTHPLGVNDVFADVNSEEVGGCSRQKQLQYLAGRPL